MSCASSKHDTRFGGHGGDRQQATGDVAAVPEAQIARLYDEAVHTPRLHPNSLTRKWLYTFRRVYLRPTRG